MLTIRLTCHGVLQECWRGERIINLKIPKLTDCKLPMWSRLQARLLDTFSRTYD